jgi:hypothetical protein
MIGEGLTFNINETNNIVTVYNSDCISLDNQNNFELNVGINFDIICNQ